MKKAIFKYFYEELNLDLGNPDTFLNGGVDWHNGGFRSDDGSREAKPQRELFSTHGCNSDSLSGEDPTKPGVTGFFLARYMANWIVKNEDVDYARVSLRYKINQPKLYKIDIETEKNDRKLQQYLQHKMMKTMPIDLEDTITFFNLKSPELYRLRAASSDPVYNIEFPWEQV
jgi:S-adenosylmethionine synthetase